MLKSNVGSVFFWRGGPRVLSLMGCSAPEMSGICKSSFCLELHFQNTPRKMGIKRPITLAPRSLCLAAVAAGNVTGHDWHRGLLGREVKDRCSKAMLVLFFFGVVGQRVLSLMGCSAPEMSGICKISFCLELHTPQRCCHFWSNGFGLGLWCLQRHL